MEKICCWIILWFHVKCAVCLEKYPSPCYFKANSMKPVHLLNYYNFIKRRNAGALYTEAWKVQKVCFITANISSASSMHICGKVTWKSTIGGASLESTNLWNGKNRKLYRTLSSKGVGYFGVHFLFVHKICLFCLK